MMKRLTRGCCRWKPLWRTGAVLLITTPAVALGQLPSSWTEPFDPVQIADNLYYVGSAGLGAFLLTSSEGHVLVDAPMEANVPLILDGVRTLGFHPGDIELHVVTHAHYDHVEGLAALMAETGGELVASAADGSFLERGEDFGFDSDGYPAVSVHRTVGNLETVAVGDTELTAHLTPGHTPGCTTWTGTTTIQGQERTFLILCSLSALSIYRLGGDDPTYEGQAEDFCSSLAHLETLTPDVFLANHGQFFGLERKAMARRGGDESAFVGDGELARFLERARTAIDAARTRAGLPSCR